MEWVADPAAWVAPATLTALEIVLGIDNIIFISILVSGLPFGQQRIARTVGLALAAGSRIALLFSIAWVMSLTTPFVSLGGKEVSGRDLILLAGGLFLLWKSVHEIHGTVEGKGESAKQAVTASFVGVVGQIALLDIVFSLDSVITAVGLVDEVPIMVIAILLAVGLMIFAAGAISQFVERNPTIKARVELPRARRCCARRRRMGIPLSQGVHLLLNGVRGHSGAP